MDQLFQHLRVQCSNDALKRNDYQFCTEIENIVFRLQHWCQMQKILSLDALRNDIIAGSIQRPSVLLPWFHQNQCMFVYHVLTEIIMRGYSHHHNMASHVAAPIAMNIKQQQQLQQQPQPTMRKFEFADNHQTNYQPPAFNMTHAAANNAYQSSPTTSTPECHSVSHSPATQSLPPNAMPHKTNYSYSSSRSGHDEVHELSAAISAVADDDVPDLYAFDDDGDDDEVRVVPVQHDSFAIWMQHACGCHTHTFYSVQIPITSQLVIEYSVRDLIEYLQNATLSNLNVVWQHDAIHKNEDELIGEKKALWLCLHTLLCLSIKCKYRHLANYLPNHMAAKPCPDPLQQQEQRKALLVEFNKFPQHPTYLQFLTTIINMLCGHFLRRSLRQELNANHLSLKDNVSASDIVMGFGDLVEELPIWLLKVNELILREREADK